MCDDNLDTRTSSSSSTEFEFNVLCEDSPVSPRFLSASLSRKRLGVSNFQATSDYNVFQHEFGARYDYGYTNESAACYIVQKRHMDLRSLMLQERESKKLYLSSSNAFVHPRKQDGEEMEDVEDLSTIMSASSAESFSDSQCISSSNSINLAGLAKGSTSRMCKLHCFFRRICLKRKHHRSCRIHHEPPTCGQRKEICGSSCRSSKRCHLWKAANHPLRNEGCTASKDSASIPKAGKIVPRNPRLDVAPSTTSITNLHPDRQNLNSRSTQDSEENKTKSEGN
ncbi:hypothetical protein KP509_01G039200 [Ceratopteris richardii]|nr:hypothetical protein KP509_01G039200 [Ceratopteris richardii]